MKLIIWNRRQMRAKQHGGKTVKIGVDVDKAKRSVQG